jgi:hypothetical protein
MSEFWENLIDKDEDQDSLFEEPILKEKLFHNNTKNRGSIQPDKQQSHVENYSDFKKDTLKQVSPSTHYTRMTSESIVQMPIKIERNPDYDLVYRSFETYSKLKRQTT